MKKILAILSILTISCTITFNVSYAREARLPSPSGYVNDFANVLSRDAEAGIEGVLAEIERKTGAEVAVAAIQTTKPLTIEQYAVNLFQKWGIGKKGKDNGILILVAAGDRKVRIEVGYGLEGAVTDLESKSIIEYWMVPAFKKGDYSGGISTAVVKLAELIGNEYGVKINLNAQITKVRAGSRKKSKGGSLISLLFFILIFGFRFGSLFWLMGSGRRSYWSGGSGGSFGGGFGGFGGGFSGGGGASGSW